MDEVKKAHQNLENCRKERNKVLEFARKFNNDDALVEKYQEKAAIKLCKDFGITDKKEIDDTIRAYKFDDLDQGRDNSFGLYCKDKNVDYDKYLSEVIEADQKYKQSCKNYTNELLGKYGDEVIYTSSMNRDYKLTVSNMVTNALEQLDDDERFKQGYYFSY